MTDMSYAQFCYRYAPIMPYKSDAIARLCVVQSWSPAVLRQYSDMLSDEQISEKKKLKMLACYMEMNNIPEIESHPMDLINNEYRLWLRTGVINVPELEDLAQYVVNNVSTLINTLSDEFCFEEGIDPKELEEKHSYIFPECLWALKSGYDIACFLCILARTPLSDQHKIRQKLIGGGSNTLDI